MSISLNQLLNGLILLLVLIGVYLSHQAINLYEAYYLAENGPTEWMSLIGLFYCSLICFYRIPILSPFRPRLFLASLLIQGTFFLLWGLEAVELIESPPVRLHTLFSYYMGAYFVVMPILFKKLTKIQNALNELAIAVPSWSNTALYIALLGLTRFTAGEGSNILMEFAFAWLMVALLLAPINREVFSRKVLGR